MSVNGDYRSCHIPLQPNSGTGETSCGNGAVNTGSNLKVQDLLNLLKRATPEEIQEFKDLFGEDITKEHHM